MSEIGEKLFVMCAMLVMWHTNGSVVMDDVRSPYPLELRVGATRAPPLPTSSTK